MKHLLLLLLLLSTPLFASTTHQSQGLSQTRPRDPDLKNTENLTLFLEGFIFGFLGDDATEVKTCMIDAQNISTEFWDAIDDFRGATPFNLI